MTVEIAIVFVVFSVAVLLFVTSALQPDVVALLILAALLVTGVVDPQTAFRSFVASAPVAIASMFVLSEGLVRTGIVARLGDLLEGLVDGKPSRLFLCAVVLVMPISAFVNNTPVVVLFLPIIIRVAGQLKKPASKFLIPLSYGAILGGTCTLVGTSTNILVSSIYSSKPITVTVTESSPLHGAPAAVIRERWEGKHVLKAVERNHEPQDLDSPAPVQAGDVLFYESEPLSMFEFSRLGLIFCATGIAYLVLFGRRLLPERATMTALLGKGQHTEYLTEIRLSKESPFVGQAVSECELSKQANIRVVQLIRGEVVRVPAPDSVLKVGDILLVSGTADHLMRLDRQKGVEIVPGLKEEGQDRVRRVQVTLAEIVIRPGSPLIGQTLGEAAFRRRYSVGAFAILRQGVHVREALSKIRLRLGDVLLVQGTPDDIQRLRHSNDFVLVEDVQRIGLRRESGWVAVTILAAVVFGATFKVLPVHAVAFLGALAMILTRCLTAKEAYASIDWSVIALIGGTIALGFAMQDTGAAKWAISKVIGVVEGVRVMNPRWLLLVIFFLLTNVATEVMSNTAAAALLTPLALATGTAVGVDPRPYVVAVAFAASCSFSTPIGYQTNTFVYGPGGYRFTDFARVGLPLNLLLWILASFLIPFFWPFETL